MSDAQCQMQFWDTNDHVWRDGVRCVGIVHMGTHYEQCGKPLGHDGSHKYCWYHSWRVKRQDQ